MALPSSPRRNQKTERMSGGSSSKSIGSLKKRFLQKWISSLKSCSSMNNLSSLNERKNFIKLTADLTMASLRDGSTRWSRALIDTASGDAQNKLLLQQITVSHRSTSNNTDQSSPIMPQRSSSIAKKITSKKIVKRSRAGAGSRNKMMRKGNVGVGDGCLVWINGCYRPTASSIAKRLLKKRTQLLKNLVPGGESMDDMSLIKETLDYIVSLQAQVDVMRSLARATDLVLSNVGK